MENYRATFREGIKTGAFSTCKNEVFDPHNLALFTAAVLQGYQDAKRTFKNIGATWEACGADSKDAFFTRIAQELQGVFQQFPEEGFDRWHENACMLFLQLLADNGYSSATYGQAQKVINMAFKYLYCLEGADNYSHVFEQCHMPLDSYILGYLREECAWKVDTILASDKWSKLNKEDYLRITTAVFAKCSEMQGDLHYPLFAEFYIWPQALAAKQ